jgi:hypothetical protein
MVMRFARIGGGADAAGDHRGGWSPTSLDVSPGGEPALPGGHRQDHGLDASFSSIFPGLATPGSTLAPRIGYQLNWDAPTTPAKELSHAPVGRLPRSRLI